MNEDEIKRWKKRQNYSSVGQEYRDAEKQEEDRQMWEDWEDGRAKRAERMKRIEKARRYRDLPDDLICPVCERRIVECTRWVRIYRLDVLTNVPICRSCWQVRRIPQLRQAGYDESKMRVDVRWRLRRGTLPLDIRVELRTLGWHPTMIARALEGQRRMTQIEMTTILKIWPECVEYRFDDSRWYDGAGQLKELRRTTGLSMRVLAEKLDWSPSRLRLAEAAGPICRRDLDLILENLVPVTDESTST